MKASNPLLVALNALPIFNIPCQRKYTTIHKDGTYRVKFYDVALSKLPKRADMVKALASAGWTNITIDTYSHPWQRVQSVTVFAEPK